MYVCVYIYIYIYIHLHTLLLLPRSWPEALASTALVELLCTAQFIGPINDEKVGGLESLLNYMNENFFTKDDPAVNEHHYDKRWL